ncbi:MAG TPA: hypothetical protein VF095_06885 [Bacillota bacterium]
MTEDERQCLNQLFLKVQQHEETIAQLVEILAMTNCRLVDVTDILERLQHYSYNPNKMFPER